MTTANSLNITGKLGNRVYQRTAPGKGNISNGGAFDMQDRAHVIPLNPRTPAQQANRARMAAAVAVWHTLDDAGRQAWKNEAEARGITAFNAFLSAELRSPV